MYSIQYIGCGFGTIGRQSRLWKQPGFGHEVRGIPGAPALRARREADWADRGVAAECFYVDIHICVRICICVHICICFHICICVVYSCLYLCSYLCLCSCLYLC